MLMWFDDGCRSRDNRKLLARQIQGFNLSAEDLDFDDGWLSSIIWMSDNGYAVLAKWFDVGCRRWDKRKVSARQRRRKAVVEMNSTWRLRIWILTTDGCCRQYDGLTVVEMQMDNGYF